MTVEFENPRMVALGDLPDQQSRRHGADLTFGGSCNLHPTTSLHLTILKTFRTQFAGGLPGNASLTTVTKSTKAFSHVQLVQQ
jgi:hypothetical protein